MADERPQPKYKDVAADMRKNMAANENMFYADLMSRGNGQEGQRNGLTAAFLSFRKMGLEGMLSTLEAKAERSIANEKGITGARFDVEEQIQMGAQTFQQSYLSLKPADIAAYIKDAAGIDIEVRGEATMAELDAKIEAKEASKEEMVYFNYIIGQMQYAVMAKCAKAVYSERANRDTRNFSEAFPSAKK